MGIVKRVTASSKSCKSSRHPHIKLGGVSKILDNDRFFTLKSLGAPEKVHLPVEIIERQKFSKSSIKKFSADEILRKKREDLKKNLKDFIDVAFPSSTSPYKHLLSSPGPITSLEKYYIANQRELKPPKYMVSFDESINSYYFSLDFNDNIEYSDAMPIKILAKLQVAHKALMRIRKQMKEKAAREKAEKEKVTKELVKKVKAAMSIEINQINDQPNDQQKKFYLHPRVRRLWASKKREPKDNDWFIKNASHRNFALFKEFYPNIDESKSRKRKSIDWNKEEIFQEGVYTQTIKKIRLKKENETFTQIADNIPESVDQTFQPTNEFVLKDIFGVARDKFSNALEYLNTNRKITGEKTILNKSGKLSIFSYKSQLIRNADRTIET
ncbi:hypothetical protein C1645_801033 [Glomus cerebriforme]|uniref:Uncharacterized protein n=1 Tax=Glomus cerebriforme TaxID=658196 RepID=A0A397TKD3_9GLOM|nr:hypothetical protein C1645_801033 [Glomus cerebriforme]